MFRYREVSLTEFCMVHNWWMECPGGSSLRRGETDIDCTKEEIPVPYNEAYFDCAQEKVFMMKL